jgi:hypothetical protein
MALRLVKLDRFELHVTEAQHVDLLTNAMPLALMEVPPIGLRGKTSSMDRKTWLQARPEGCRTRPGNRSGFWDPASGEAANL